MACCTLKDPHTKINNLMKTIIIIVGVQVAIITVNGKLAYIHNNKNNKCVNNNKQPQAILYSSEYIILYAVCIKRETSRCKSFDLRRNNIYRDGMERDRDEWW